MDLLIPVRYYTYIRTNSPRPPSNLHTSNPLSTPRSWPDGSRAASHDVAGKAGSKAEGKDRPLYPMGHRLSVVEFATRVNQTLFIIAISGAHIMRNIQELKMVSNTKDSIYCMSGKQDPSTALVTNSI